MIGIIDYGMGNLRSVENALKKLNAEALISDDENALGQCEKIILPGVGAFGDCMANLKNSRLDTFVQKCIDTGKPLLGICVGMQMLFEKSEEKGIHEGLGYFKGRIKRLETDLPVPQIGWNELVLKDHPLKKKLSEVPYVYYVHSYHAADYDEKDLAGYSFYGDVKVPGLFVRGHVMAAQFHPEKSAEDGLKILDYFLKEPAMKMSRQNDKE